MSNGQLVFIQGSDAIDVHLHGQTLWLTQAQMAQVFGSTPENVLMHLKNIYAEGELDAAATAKDFLAVRQEGTRQVKRRLKHYNLDAIISVGYRVSSTRATQFRIWATGVLRQHLTDGVTLNQRRLHERGVTTGAAGQRQYFGCADPAAGRKRAAAKGLDGGVG